jgi:hypothetical protein
MPTNQNARLAHYTKREREKKRKRETEIKIKRERERERVKGKAQPASFAYGGGRHVSEMRET